MLRLRAAYAPQIVGRSIVQTGGIDPDCCVGYARNDNAVSIGWAPDPNTYDLHHANASRFGARKELLLLEDHLSHEKCPECTYKHLDRAIAFLDEARTLDEGDARDTLLAMRLSALSPTIGDEAKEIRLIRREIGIILGRGKNANDVETSGVLVGAGLTSSWTDDDFRTLSQIAAKYKIADPAFLLLVMASESGLQPNAANPLKNGAGNPAAVGLIQFTQIANDAVGITEAQRADMVNWSVADQLPLVDKYFGILPWSRAGNTYDSAAAVYEGVFAGGLMMSKGTSDDTVLYTEGVDGSAYTANKGFDVDHKGYITVGDLGKHLDFVASGPVYREALDRLRSVGGTASDSGGSSTSWLYYAVVGVLAAGAGIYAFAR